MFFKPAAGRALTRPLPALLSPDNSYTTTVIISSRAKMRADKGRVMFAHRQSHVPV